ncbi:MAG: flagellin, partial [Sulfurimonadaceae bacterium]|nr:flagellin [Sulfurimonadaceae bacterium]
TLSATRDRTEVLIVSSMSLRSDVIDTDVAEASLRLQQLSLNMQAIYSMTSRISQLSLVNYL